MLANMNEDTVKSISEMRVVNLRLRCLNERATYW
jgi:hypothetical protein